MVKQVNSLSWRVWDRVGGKVFENFSLGVVTNRDSWCYNFSKKILTKNMENMIEFYVEQLISFNEVAIGFGKNKREEEFESFINNDPKKISWTRSLKSDFIKNKSASFQPECLTKGLYRPFSKYWIYFNRTFNEMVYQMPRIFPTAESENLIISTVGVGTPKTFSVVITDVVPDLQLQANGQCFPLYLYEPTKPTTLADDLFSRPDDGLDSPQQPQYTRRDAITDEGLAHFADYYASQSNGETISKEDLFYYIYGLLHSEDYRERYADNLSKELPRIPRVKTYADFKHFSDAGRQLAHYHLNYETVEAYPVSFNTNLDQLTDADFYVTKMKFGKGKGDDRHDKTTVIYNHKITLSGIPLEAYDYVVNGKAALDWVMERQSVKTDKDSGITNDANDWAIETMGNARYPLELFQRVITVSLATLKIVKGLPPLDIE